MKNRDMFLAYEVCEMAGMAYITHDFISSQKEIPLWDGERAHFFSDLSPSNILHELAHWLVEPLKYRKLPNFGFGYDPETSYWDKAVNHQKYSEEQASLLGILIEKSLGFPWMKTWKDHTWDENEGEWLDQDFAKTLQSLYDNGLIDSELRPIWKKRQEKVL